MSEPLREDQIEIADGQMLSHLTSVDLCQVALLTLARDIGRIEDDLADPAQQDDEWVRRAASALRFKKKLIRTVEERAALYRRAALRDNIARDDRHLIAVFKAHWPTEFAKALHLARSSPTPNPRETAE